MKRCLEPDPADRWQAASDVKKELEWAAVSAPAPAITRPSSSRLAWGVAALAFVGMLSIGVLYLRRQPGTTLGPTQFTLALDKEIQGLRSEHVAGALPYRAIPRLRWRWTERRNLVVDPVAPIGRNPPSARHGRCGPGRMVARWKLDRLFRRWEAEEGKPARGAAANHRSGARIPGSRVGIQRRHHFSPDESRALFRIRDSGGSPQPLTTLNTSLTENSHRFPEFLPGGRLFFFVSRCGERANNALYIGSLDSPEVIRVMPAQSRVSYVPAAARAPGDARLLQ